MSQECEAAGLRNAQEQHRCRITVLRKDFNREFYQLCPYGAQAPCSRHDLGQSFVTESRWDPPAGFCAWAWGDIRPVVMAVHGGETAAMVACCTDGLRPVYFKIEREEASRGVPAATGNGCCAG
jgi:uncharacterized repeat protein (TIGR04076 family)